MNDKSNIQPRAKIMWYFEPRIDRKKSRYRSTFLVRLLGSKYFIILALVGYLLIIGHYYETLNKRYLHFSQEHTLAEV